MSQRYIFFDVLRGLAVLWMIQVHVTNVFLEPALRSGWWFSLLNVSNGFVAPAFIFCAGGGLWIALNRKGEAFLRFDSSLWQYLRRLSIVLFWGYALHFPIFVYGSVTGLTTEQWSTGLQIDVLHTIVYSSLIALAFFFVVRTPKRFTPAIGVLAFIVSFSSSYVSSVPATSPFPLLPWSAYLFAGAATVGWFMERENKRLTSYWLIGIGVVLLPWTEFWWTSTPGSQLFRIAGILVAFGGLYLIENQLSTMWVGRVLQKMGQESLFLYVSHLLIVYSWGPTITEALFGFTTTSAFGIVAIWMIVTAPLVATALWWNKKKRSRK